ncbi:MULTISPECIES: mannose-1-phosphate guanylyltransferase [Pseudobutyrivibrio]|uniref:mannose-1-phosphate guanylyltransferase n=1 Tax=Pseudobutyrivibrio xylanivorans TaxID=185007 RepID=A0A6M0LN82_PSEXY|nr:MULTISPECIES: mannose-1-phosphate guanylyltransferase [Pseudobutyrivibrio]NEX02291.1 mannose-1-phosphate guanylyltransferase [Pseudobutyrivibrio xylanivorans]
MQTYGVIMAGGGGTRFWPLSRHEVPKQLLNLSGKDLMVNETIDRVATLCDKSDIFIVTNVDQVPGMEKATTGRIKPDHILSEPSARNTAACIGYAAFEIVKKYGDGVMCIFPSDHYIKNEAAFTATLKDAIAEAEQGSLVTMGITPTFPCTGYGYIRFDKTETATAKKVVEFKEKPDLKTAEEYVASGEYSWNSGMFVWKASVILAEFEKLLPDVYACLTKIADAMGTADEKKVIDEVYPTIPSISIDYGIMEKSDKVKVISAEMGWNDVGSWDNLGVLHEADSDGNVFAGDHLAIDTKGCITYSKKRLISTVGVENLIIVETDDAIMVVDKSRAQDVKLIVEELKKQGRNELL